MSTSLCPFIASVLCTRFSTYIVRGCVFVLYDNVMMLVCMYKPMVDACTFVHVQHIHTQSVVTLTCDQVVIVVLCVYTCVTQGASPAPQQKSSTPPAATPPTASTPTQQQKSIGGMVPPPPSSSKSM